MASTNHLLLSLVVLVVGWAPLDGSASGPLVWLLSDDGWGCSHLEAFVICMSGVWAERTQTAGGWNSWGSKGTSFSFFTDSPLGGLRGTRLPSYMVAEAYQRDCPKRNQQKLCSLF